MKTLARLLATAMFLAAPAAVATGLAHDWYPTECCYGGKSGGDCAPIPTESMTPAPNGWTYKPTGETIPFGDTRLRISEDGRFHRCVMYVPTGMASKTRCLFVPPPAL